MEFDQYAVVLLRRPENLLPLEPENEAELQDAHLHHLASIHEAGQMRIAGPLDHERHVGLSIWGVDVNRARELTEQDPKVLAGRLVVEAYPWMVPAGAMALSPARLPHSVAVEIGAAENV